MAELQSRMLARNQDRSGSLAAVCRAIRIALIVGLALRVLVAATTVWPDNEAFFRLALRTVVSSGSGAPFGDIYPSTWITIISVPLSILARIRGLSALSIPLPGGELDLSSVGLPLTLIPGRLVMAALKLPCIAIDLAIGLLIYYIVREFSGDKRTGLAFSLWFLNPMVIVESSLLGQYDAFVGFFSLLSVFLIIRRQFWAAGIAFALGFLLKPLSLYLGVSLAVYLIWLGLTQHRSSASAGRAGSLLEKLTGWSLVLKFGVGCIIPMLAFLAGVVWLGVGQSAVTRLTFPQLGGINLWFIELVPLQIADSAFIWGYAHFSGVQAGSLFVGLALSVLLTVMFIRWRVRTPAGLYLLGQLTLVLYPLTATLTGAHYYIPFIAFLVVGVALSQNSEFWFWALCSCLAGWVLSVWGPIFIWLPISVNWGLLPPEPMLRWTINYVSVLEWHGVSVFLALRLVLTIVSLASLLSIFAPSVYRLCQATSEARTGERSNK